MENKKLKKVIEKIKTCHPTLKILIANDKIDKNLIHLQIDDQNSGDILRGSGTDHLTLVALKKAYSEYIERLHMEYSKEMFHFKINSSNGLAAHPSFKQVIQKSREELIERDAFLLSWLTFTSPYWLSKSEMESLKLSPLFKFDRKFYNLQMAWKIGIVAKTGNIFTCIGMILPAGKDKHFGIAIDTASSTNLHEAIIKCFQGICYWATAVANRMNDGKVFKEKLPSIKKTSDHFEYYLNPKHTPEWMINSSAKEILQLPYPTDIISLTIKPIIQSAWPLYVCHSTSQDHQPFYLGKPKDKEINLKRIKKIFKKGKERIKINAGVNALP